MGWLQAQIAPPVAIRAPKKPNVAQMCGDPRSAREGPTGHRKIPGIVETILRLHSLIEQATREAWIKGLMHRILKSARDGEIKQGSRFAFGNANHVLAANHLTRPFQHLSRSSRCVSCRTALSGHTPRRVEDLRLHAGLAPRKSHIHLWFKSLRRHAKCKRAF